MNLALETFTELKENDKIIGFVLENVEHYQINTITDCYDINKLHRFEISFGPSGFWFNASDDKGATFYLEYDPEYNIDIAIVGGDLYLNKWDRKFSFSHYISSIQKSLEKRSIKNGDIKNASYRRHNDFENGEIRFTYGFNIFLNYNTNPIDVFYKIQNNLYEIREDIERLLNNDYISPEILNDEKKFSISVLLPLFRRMFIDVKYNHGPREFGKDITFSEIDKFDLRRNYGVQIKSGNVSGKASAVLDKLIAQIDDAFNLYYIDEASQERRYISYLIIAISGRFIGNAQDKIIEKTKNKNVIFLSIDKIQELLTKYLGKIIEQN